MANTARITQSVIESATGQTGAATITQSVVELLTGLGITCDSPPSGQPGFAYTHTFPSGGGVGPFTFSITAGALPTGLTLAAATGIVSGTPTTPGTYSFTIQVIDSLGALASVACSITIGPFAIILTLVGWKLYPEGPCEDTVPGVEIPKVDRAV